MAAASLATLRSKIEFDLRGRVPAPFTYRDRNVFELVSCGIPEIDASVGGLPRGALTEICGAPGSGKTSLLTAALAARTAAGEVCALVDARDSFDPGVAHTAGVTLKQFLWVRCHDLNQALRATDLLIQSGGFGLVAVDLSDVPQRTVRQVPLNAWFRFRRAVEDTPAILLLLEQEANAKTCASLVLRLEGRHVQWSTANDQKKIFLQGLKPNVSAQITPELKLRPPKEKTDRSVPFTADVHLREAVSLGGGGFQPPRKTREHSGALAPEANSDQDVQGIEITPGFSRLLRGFSVHFDVVRSRVQLPAHAPVIDIREKQSPEEAEIFNTGVTWSAS
jgi:recombination protein RecA